MLFAFVGAALAQEPACAGPLSLAALRFDLDEAEIALGKGPSPAAGQALAAALDAFPCGSEPLAPEDVARAARLASLLAFFHQDSEEIERWARLWRAVSPDVGAQTRNSESPERWVEITSGYGPTDVAGPGVGLVPPKKGVILVDGRPTVTAETEVGVPHLIQVLDRNGSIVAAFWQDDVVFPAEWLGASAPSVPAWWSAFEAERGPYLSPPTAPVPAPVADPASAPVAPEAPEAPEVSCAWGEGNPASVEATNRAVTVEGTVWPIRSDAQREGFRSAVLACGELRASRRFDRWLEAKGKLFSRDARSHRDTLVRFLLEAEPVKGGRRGKAPPSPAEELPQPKD